MPQSKQQTTLSRDLSTNIDFIKTDECQIKEKSICLHLFAMFMHGPTQQCANKIYRAYISCLLVPEMHQPDSKYISMFHAEFQLSTDEDILHCGIFVSMFQRLKLCISNISKECLITPLRLFINLKSASSFPFQDRPGIRPIYWTAHCTQHS